MTPFDEQAEALLMEAVAHVAAEAILPRFRALDAADINSKDFGDDLVTIADRESERRISEAISTILPGAVIVGEEAVSEGRTDLGCLATAEQAVIIDPVDGTWNFANGLGVFGVILAVVDQGETLWGGIYDPIGGDWVTARRGEGAWFSKRNQRRAVTAAGGPTTLAEAHGHLPTFYFAPEKRATVINACHDVRRFSHLGCSAHEYRTVAQGRVDFALSGGLKPWDHAAGALIVKEAGGTVGLLDGGAYRPATTAGHLLVARNDALWNAAAARFAELA